MKKQIILTIVLIVILVAAAAYIAVTQIQKYYEQQSVAIYQAGMQKGYESAVKQLMDQLVTCKPMPVHADNATINAIAVECLPPTKDYS